MPEIISFLCLLLAFTALTALFIIDLRTQLLPNALVLIFTFLGIAFHISTGFYYESSTALVLGALLGGALLYLVRAMGNSWYKTETLGVGDVKLMAGGGLWLGLPDILPAIIAGAVFALLYGAALLIHEKRKSGRFPRISTFSLPAGPGFVMGLVIIGVAKFWGLPHLSI